MQIFIADGTWESFSASCRKAELNTEAVLNSLLLAFSPAIRTERDTREFPPTTLKAETDLFISLKNLCRIYEVKQEEIADYLKITPAAVSQSISKKNMGSLLYKAVMGAGGAELFLSEVLWSRYLPIFLKIQEFETELDEYHFFEAMEDSAKVLLGYTFSHCSTEEFDNLLYEPELLKKHILEYSVGLEASRKQGIEFLYSGLGSALAKLKGNLLR